MRRYTAPPPNTTDPDWPRVRAAAALTDQHDRLEHHLPALAAAAPATVVDALAAHDLDIWSIGDDVSRYLTAAAVAHAVRDPMTIVRLAARELGRQRIPHDTGAMLRRVTSYCEPCIMARRQCIIAASELRRVAAALADLRRRMRDASAAYTYADRRLRGAA